jgi:hypothetical protein
LNPSAADRSPATTTADLLLRSAASRWANGFFAVGAGFAVTLWLWNAFCAFPHYGWNAVRVAPSFMLRAGITPYPAPGAGPVTTWIYGPTAIFCQLPATLASGPVAALLAAGGINLALALVPLLFVLRREAGERKLEPRRLWLAAAVAIAIWPSWNLFFYQADNAALAFGLMSMGLLGGGPDRSRGRGWLAAALVALAVWGKQTELGVICGQVIFVARRDGIRAAGEHLLRVIACCALAGCVFLKLFGDAGLWFNAFVVPASLPRVSLFAKAMSAPFAGAVVSLVMVPLFGLLFARRAVFSRGSRWALPAWIFVCSLPFTLAAFSSIGGNLNSLHACVFLLPVAAAALLQRLPPARQWLAAALVIAIVGWQSARTPLWRWRPATSALRQAESLTQQLPGEIYFPWNPLITFYGEHRFDHAEDGLVTRSLAGRPVSPPLLHRYLPPRMHVVAYQSSDVFYREVGTLFLPKNAVAHRFGEWTLFSWPEPSSRRPD